MQSERKPLQKTELSKMYYVKEKTLEEIAKHFGYDNVDTFRYHLRKKDTAGNPEYRNRDRELSNAEIAEMLNVFAEQANGEDFLLDMAKVSIFAQVRMSKAIEWLQEKWEEEYGKVTEDIAEYTAPESTLEVLPAKKCCGGAIDKAIKVNIQLTHENSRTPSYLAAGAAGMSLSAVEQVYLRPGDALSVPTGISLDVPDGFCGLVVSEPSMVETYGIAVLGAPLVLAPGQHEDLKIKLVHQGKGISSTMHEVGVGQKIAQVVFVAVPIVTWNVV